MTRPERQKNESQLLAIHGTAVLIHPWTSPALYRNAAQSTYLEYASFTAFSTALLFAFFARSVDIRVFRQLGGGLITRLFCYI